MRVLTEAQRSRMRAEQGIVLEAPCPCHPEFERQLAAAGVQSAFNFNKANLYPDEELSVIQEYATRH